MKPYNNNSHAKFYCCWPNNSLATPLKRCQKWKTENGPFRPALTNRDPLLIWKLECGKIFILAKYHHSSAGPICFIAFFTFCSLERDRTVRRKKAVNMLCATLILTHMQHFKVVRPVRAEIKWFLCVSSNSSPVLSTVTGLGHNVWCTWAIVPAKFEPYRTSRRTVMAV